MSKIGITGASGHIGGVLCKELLSSGYEIGLFVYQSKIDLNIPQQMGDITNQEDVDKFVSKYDKIIHLAADISVDNKAKDQMWRTNVEGTKNIADACLKFNIQRLIHFSSIAAIDQFPLEKALNEKRVLVSNNSHTATEYGKSKAAAEREILKRIDKGLDVVMVAPTSVLGPMDYKPSVLGQSLLDMYHNSIPAVVKGGQDWVDVRDIVAGTILALEKGRAGEKYLLGSEFHTIQELAQMIGDIYNRKVPTLALPFWIARLGVPFEQIKSRRSGKPNGFTQEGLTALKYGNTSILHDKATKELGYTPRAVKESLKDTLDWLVAHYG
ncbi:MAG: dihydroflavonol-4-reductase [Chitinophagales bacterium]|jgi:dihydroflavonol-4-reductase